MHEPFEPPEEYSQEWNYDTTPYFNFSSWVFQAFNTMPPYLIISDRDHSSFLHRDIYGN